MNPFHDLNTFSDPFLNCTFGKLLEVAAIVEQSRKSHDLEIWPSFALRAQQLNWYPVSRQFKQEDNHKKFPPQGGGYPKLPNDGL